MWIAALVGLGASAEASRVHYRLLTDPGYAPSCDVSSAVNCTNAYASAYGVLAGVPTAVLGVWFFALVLLVLGLTSLSRDSRGHAANYMLALSSVGLLMVGYLGYASLAVIGTVCLLCVTTYVAVVGLFIAAVTATRESMSVMPERLVADLRRLFSSPVAAAAVVAAVVGAGALWSAFPAETVRAAAVDGGDEQQAAVIPPLSPAQQQELQQYLNAQQRVPVMVATEGAAVVLVKFNDYMCPPCGQTFAEYKPVLAKWAKEYPGKLKFVTKDYPLDPECNQFAPGGSHMASCEAAVAVRLAREKGKAAEMEDWLFANQPRLTTANVKQAAQMIAGVTDFDARYQTTLQLVKGDIAQGGQLQVQGTPTFFLNGIRLPGLRAQFLDAAIAMEMKRAGVALK